MPKKKIKAGELTLNKIVEIAEKYKGSCCNCPLVNVIYLNCFNYCDKDNIFKRNVKKELKKEIEVEE